MGTSDPCGNGAAEREALFRAGLRELGAVLNRLVNGYEADTDKRHDLWQEIHFRLWKSLEGFDGRCSLRTWTLRVAHNTAVSYVTREKRWRARFLSIEEVETKADPSGNENEAGALDRQRALDQLYALIRELKPIDRQVILSWLEDLDAASIAEITGLSSANVAMKIHRIKSVLVRRFHQEQQTCMNRQNPNR